MAQVEVIKFLDGPTGVTNKIKRAMYDVAQQFVYIGFLLWEVQEYGYYREHGYENVYQYAEVELDMKKTTVKNLIGINYAFGCRNERDSGGIANSRTMSLQAPYTEFKYSQLTEMLSMSPAQRKQVTPDMTVKQIREIKKADKQVHVGQTSDFVVAFAKVNGNSVELMGATLRRLVQAAGYEYNPDAAYSINVSYELGGASDD